jgi:hypothetical protein
MPVTAELRSEIVTQDPEDVRAIALVLSAQIEERSRGSESGASCDHSEAKDVEYTVRGHRDMLTAIDLKRGLCAGM